MKGKEFRKLDRGGQKNAHKLVERGIKALQKGRP